MRARIADKRRAERDRRQNRDATTPPMPETGSQPRRTANRIASSGPSQKFGIEMPASENVIAA